jgi:hypothetical protein
MALSMAIFWYNALEYTCGTAGLLDYDADIGKGKRSREKELTIHDL